MALPALPTVAGSPCEQHGCSACCHDIEMLLTEADLKRLRRIRPEEAFWFLADDGHLQLHNRDAPAAPGGHGRPCWFLDETGKCSVWADRPEGCRLYPAIWDEGLRAATLDADYCPHTDGFRLPKSMDDATRRLAQRLMAERDARDMA